MCVCVFYVLLVVCGWYVECVCVRLCMRVLLTAYLDQYQAQIASALKPAFTPDAYPLVTCAAYADISLYHVM